MKSKCEEIFDTLGDHQAPQRKVLEGEGIECEFYDASDNGYPPDMIFATSIDDIKQEKDLGTQRRFSEIEVRRKYLWVLMKKKLMVAPEVTPAETSRGCICHTNLTGGNDAVIGGELWFLKTDENDFEIYINFDSGRYGTVNAAVQHQAVFDLFNCVGYKAVKPLSD